MSSYAWCGGLSSTAAAACLEPFFSFVMCVKCHCNQSYTYLFESFFYFLTDIHRHDGEYRQSFNRRGPHHDGDYQQALPAGDSAPPSETVLLVVHDDKYWDANLAAIGTGDRLARSGVYHLLRFPRTDLANHEPPPDD